MGEAAYDSRPDTYSHQADVRGFLLALAKDLVDRAHVHDNSKLESPEREMFDRVTPRLSGLEYGSEEYKAMLREMGEGLQHHYQVNMGHHPDALPMGIRSMSLVDLLEMIVDWMAAVKRHDDDHDIRDSIEKNQERFHYSDELKIIFLNTVYVLEAMDV